MAKFIVVTVDHDEQQTFCDFTSAPDAESALREILDEREDCCHGDAFSPAELRDLADRCEKEVPDGQETKT